MQLPIFLDHHSTTPVDPRVLEAMLPCFTHEFGNAASRTHPYGWRAQELLEAARGQVAAAIGAGRDDVVFTSGATESNNIALLGAAEALKERGNHIVTTAIEHHAVLDPCRHLESRGFQVTYLRPDRTGLILAEHVAEAITPRTILVSVMAANNEIGTINPLAEIGRVCKEKGVLFHTDAAQAVGKVEIEVDEMGIDLLGISAHKVYGPKGVGALYARRRDPIVRLSPVFYGGGHERGLRPGTPNTPGAVGLGVALTISRRELKEEAERIRGLRDRLHRAIADGLDGVVLNGHPERRLPGSLNLSFRSVPSDALLISLKDIAVSSGSACTSARVEPSYVLRAIGVPAALAFSSIRFGIGRFNTTEEIDLAAQRVVETVSNLRSIHKQVTARRPRSRPIRESVLPDRAIRDGGPDRAPDRACGGGA